MNNLLRKSSDLIEGSKSPRRKRNRRLMILLISFFLIYLFLIDRNGIFGLIELNKRIRVEKAGIDSLNVENTKLTKDISRLKTDKGFIEKVAREQYGMQKPKEVIYKVSQVPEKPINK